MLTPAGRNELNRAINSKAIRVAIFDVGIGLAILFGADTAAELWPEYRMYPLYAAAVVVVGLGIGRYNDWKSIAFLEERLGQDED